MHGLAVHAFFLSCVNEACDEMLFVASNQHEYRDVARRPRPSTQLSPSVNLPSLPTASRLSSASSTQSLITSPFRPKPHITRHSPSLPGPRGHRRPASANVRHMPQPQHRRSLHASHASPNNPGRRHSASVTPAPQRHFC
ncbi:hypothetical protein T440DRAFT_465998 [Plenodomus tracheiphilus IPT5]|uniref:Uncharacterized protein n=1 Tax=Plenodomus tracheiphilus IPT5 TaxID=1408161 RepID=A0A6A7BDY8_9PLEO|nr:hypothetical protein T440DRAFT_465998 [Plenodomus tracheiphilus IPT5]